MASRGLTADEIQQLMAKLDQIQEQMDRGFDRMNACIDQFHLASKLSWGVRAPEVVATRHHIRMVKRENRLHRPSDDLAQVPFQNGRFPWGKEVDGPSRMRVTLAALRTVYAVKNLTMPQLYGYFRGYYPGEPLPSPACRRKKILVAIGREKDVNLL
ncbi:hypothetical protein V8D89_012680 [Ganoderma adspersum]